MYIFGLLLILFIAALVYSRRADRREKAPVITAASAPAPAASTDQPQPGEPYSFKAVGVHYRADVLEYIGKEAKMYNLSDDELLAKCTGGKRVYRYSFWGLPGALEPEPDNPHDPNANQVMLDGIRIGYVPADLCPQVADLLRQGYHVDVNVRGGPVKFVSDGEVLSGDFGYTVYVDMKK